MVPNLSLSPSASRFCKRGLVVLFVAYAALFTLVPLCDRQSKVGCDFRMRYNEVLAVRSGIDPFRVWTGLQESDRFYSYNRLQLKSPDAKLPVNAYPPWEYTLLAPLTLLKFELAWKAYRAAEILALALVVGWAFSKGRALCGSVWHGLFCAAASLHVGIGAWAIWATDNFGIFLLLAMLALSWGFEHRNDIVCSLALAFLMVKPQVGALFVIPLLFGGRHRACFGAAIVCLSAALWPAARLHTSVLSLVLQIPQYGSDVAHGSLLVPRQIFSVLEQSVPQTALIAGNALVGAALCLLLSRRVRGTHPDANRFVPAVLCTALWTYSSDHDHFVFGFVQVQLAMSFLTARCSRERILPILSLLLLGGSGVMLFHAKAHSWWESLGGVVLGGIGGQILYAVDLLSSMTGILLAFVWLWRTASESPRNMR